MRSLQSGAIGDEIPLSEVTNYNGDDLTAATTGTEVRYLYDHQNLGCYECAISSNYTPVVKYYNGDLRRTAIDESTGRLIIDISEKDDLSQWVYEDGTSYTGSVDASEVIKSMELTKRRRSLYTAIGKLRNNIYKTNDYINR